MNEEARSYLRRTIVLVGAAAVGLTAIWAAHQTGLPYISHLTEGAVATAWLLVLERVRPRDLEY